MKMDSDFVINYKMLLFVIDSQILSKIYLLKQIKHGFIVELIQRLIS